MTCNYEEYDSALSVDRNSCLFSQMACTNQNHQGAQIVLCAPRFADSTLSLSMHIYTSYGPYRNIKLRTFWSCQHASYSPFACQSVWKLLKVSACRRIP